MQPMQPPAADRVLWTTADLAALPANGPRYELIDGGLLVTTAPHWQHQQTAGIIFAALHAWSQQSGLGQASLAPGLCLPVGAPVSCRGARPELTYAHTLSVLRYQGVRLL